MLRRAGVGVSFSFNLCRHYTRPFATRRRRRLWRQGGDAWHQNGGSRAARNTTGVLIAFMRLLCLLLSALAARIHCQTADESLHYRYRPHSDSFHRMFYFHNIRGLLHDDRQQCLPCSLSLLFSGLSPLISFLVSVNMLFVFFLSSSSASVRLMIFLPPPIFSCLSCDFSAAASPKSFCSFGKKCNI